MSRPEDEPVRLPVSGPLRGYVLAHFVFLIALASVALARVASLGSGRFVVVALVVTASLVGLSALLERRPYARQFEAARVLALLLLGSVYGQSLLAVLLGNS